MKWVEVVKEWIPKIKEIGMLRLGMLVLAGIVLLVASFSGEQTSDKNRKENYVEQENKGELELYISNLEQRLELVLQQVQGIGNVEVMITPKSSKEKVTLKDMPYSRKDTVEEDRNGGSRDSTEISSQEQTVMEQRENGVESPYVTKEYQPEIEGVIVIAQGADNVEIISEINEAIKALFAVPAHKIKVMKMK